MGRHFYLYTKDIFFSEGVRAVVAELAQEDGGFAFSRLESFSQLTDVLRSPMEENEQCWILCDIDSLPDERLKALYTVKELYSDKNKQLVILLGRHNISLFFALHSLFPVASWLLKNESLGDLIKFVRNTYSPEGDDVFFSSDLINYTRKKWLAKDFNNSISSDDWWLMEEIFKGKTLSQIAAEQDIDIRRLSRVKRELMKKLNVKNNVELFNTFKCILVTSDCTS